MVPGGVVNSLISKFPHVGLGVKPRKPNCPCNDFPRLPTYIMITIHQRHKQTDGQTDGRHAIARPRFAL